MYVYSLSRVDIERKRHTRQLTFYVENCFVQHCALEAQSDMDRSQIHSVMYGVIVIAKQ